MPGCRGAIELLFLNRPVVLLAARLRFPQQDARTGRFFKQVIHSDAVQTSDATPVLLDSHQLAAAGKVFSSTKSTSRANSRLAVSSRLLLRTRQEDAAVGCMLCDGRFFSPCRSTKSIHPLHCSRRKWLAAARCIVAGSRQQRGEVMWRADALAKLRKGA